VGDKTLMFRLCDAEMYTHMHKAAQSPVIDRGMALHKLLRLLTVALGGEGYLNFMGNEFGHPEWIDFPREGNGESYHHCRRQWSLADDPNLKYKYLLAFEKEMVKLLKKYRIQGAQDQQLLIHQSDKVMVYKKGGAVFAYNLHPTASFDGYFLPMPKSGEYQVVQSTDDWCFGGQGRIYHQSYSTEKLPDGRVGIRMYLPSRTAVVLHKK
jgi:1,4-alpha-glucan branching enzyme